MTKEEAIAILQTMEYELSNQVGSTYCRKKYDAVRIAIKVLEQEQKKGYWINKHQSEEDESCSAECSSCHKRSDGYAFEYGYGLKFKYYDFCPNCGSDNREVEK